MHVQLGSLPVGKWRELTGTELRGLLPAQAQPAHAQPEVASASRRLRLWRMSRYRL